MSDVEIETKNGVRWLRLNRPDRMNAYDDAMLETLLAAIAAAPSDRVLVVTGSSRAFCAGGFLANFDTAGPDELRKLFGRSLQLFDALRAHPAPVIAAVNGPAVGGGNELVVACDLAIAAESAYFGQNGPRIGSAPVFGGTNMLAVSIGEKRTKEVAFLCRRYPAREAFEMGWVNAVVPDDQLEEEVMRWADELHSMSPRYLEIAKASSNVWWNACRESYLSGLGMLTQAIGSDDMREGARAFAEKRAPRFKRQDVADS